MKGINALIIIGSILWAIDKAREVKAAPSVKEEPTLYERYQTRVPVTEEVSEEIRLFPEDFIS